MRDYKLNLTISASIGSALKSVDKLEKKLKAVSKVGGTKGKVLGALGGAVGGLRKAAVGATSAFTTLGAVGGAAISGILGPIGLAAGALKTVLGGAIAFARKALLGLAAGGVAAIAGTYAAIKALAPAGFIQQASIQMEVMLKSADRARERLRWLRGIEVRTPFNIKEIIEGANQMQAFGVFSRRAFVAAGNASAAFGKRIGDIAGPLAKLKEGLFESESLALFGITRDKLRKFGVEFGGQGELKTSGPKAFTAAIRMIEADFGGMMGRISRTWFGVLSSLRSSTFNLFAKTGKGLLEYATPSAQAVKSFVDRLGNQLARVDWSPLGTKLLAGAKFGTKLLGDVADPRTRSNVLGPMKQWLSKWPETIKIVSKGVLRDLGATMANAMNNFKPLMGWFFKQLKTAFEFSAALLRETIGSILDGAGRKFGDTLGAKVNPLGAGARELKAAKRWALSGLQMKMNKAGIDTPDNIAHIGWKRRREILLEAVDNQRPDMRKHFEGEYDKLLSLRMGWKTHAALYSRKVTSAGASERMAANEDELREWSPRSIISTEHTKRMLAHARQRQFSGQDPLFQQFQQRWHQAQAAPAGGGRKAVHDAAQVKTELRQQTQRLGRMDGRLQVMERFFQNAQLPEVP